MFSATVRTICTVCSPVGAGGRRHVELFACEFAPAHREVLRHVCHSGSLEPRGHVVPAEPPACRVIARVPAVAGHVGHVDPPDECELAVDDQRLLVMAVERVLPRIRLALDLRRACELLHPRFHLLAGRMEDRHRARQPRPARAHPVASAALASSAPTDLLLVPPRFSSKPGVMYQPVTQMDSFAFWIAFAIASKASAPSIRTSSSQP